MADQVTSCDSLHDARLHTPWMRHPCVCEDVQTVVKLQQTTKQLQTAVAECLQGQLPVVLSTVKPERLHSFEQWLAKHAGLPKGLDLRIDRSSSAGRFGNLNSRFSSFANGFLGAAAQRAVRSLLATAANRVPLQSLTFCESTASLDLLQQLSAVHLTQLFIQVDMNCSDSMQAVAALTRLQTLHLEGPRSRTNSHRAAASADDALAPLAAGLQQLTQLHVCPMAPVHLLQLPPNLQLLHITGYQYGPQELQQLAAWWQQKGRIVRSLHLFDCPDLEFRDEHAEECAAALHAVIAAFSATAAAPPAAAAAAPEATSAGLQLASVSVPGLTSDCSSAALLRALPASSLTHLACTVGWDDAADIAALCSLTGLRSLQLQQRNTYWGNSDHSITGQADGVLAQLSALQHLTRLQLSSARRVQLQRLQLPRLQRLELYMSSRQDQEQLLLGRMTSVTALTLSDNRYPCDSFAPTEQLPPNLRTLSMTIWVEPSARPYRVNLQSLLALSQLQALNLDLGGAGQRVPAAHEFAQLSTLHSLQEVRIDWASCYLDAAGSIEDMAGAFQVLPLTSLIWHHSGIPAAGVQQLGYLQGLTALELFSSGVMSICRGRYSPRDMAPAYLRAYQQERVTPAALATVLRQLTALQRLQLSDTRLGASAARRCDDEHCVCGWPAHDDTDGMVQLVQAVGSLQLLSDVGVDMRVRLQDDWQDMAAAQQLNGKIWQWPPGAGGEDLAVNVTHDHDDICTLHMHTIRN
jgi:hypothetical protein